LVHKDKDILYSISALIRETAESLFVHSAMRLQAKITVYKEAQPYQALNLDHALARHKKCDK
jgi:hypothetical protein